MVEHLFSYGTLQLEKVQLEVYGRKLIGISTRLLRYRLAEIEIKDETVVAKSNKKIHPIAQFTGIETDFIDGMIFEISNKELTRSDCYEVADYERVDEVFANHKKAWIYVCRKTNQVRKATVS